MGNYIKFGFRSLLVIFSLSAMILLGGYLAFLAYQTIFNVPDVVVPSVLNINLITAQKKLHQSGLKMEVNSQNIFSKEGDYIIVDQKPSAGSVVKKNRIIEVKIEKGSYEKDIPDLRGMSIEKAETLLSEIGLEIGEIAYSKHHQLIAGKIISQVPLPNKKLLLNEKVNILVSKGLY